MYKLKLFISKILDKSLLKSEIKLLNKKINNLENERKQFIDLNNRRLREIRSKNLEIGRLKKLIEKN